MKEMRHYQVVIEQDEDGVYIGTVLGLASCYTDGRTIEELMENLQEVIDLCERQMKRNKNEEQPVSRFIGVRDLLLQHA